MRLRYGISIIYPLSKQETEFKLSDSCMTYVIHSWQNFIYTCFFLLYVSFYLHVIKIAFDFITFDGCPIFCIYIVRVE